MHRGSNALPSLAETQDAPHAATSLLDATLARFHQGDEEGAVAELNDGLDRIRAETSLEEWREFVTRECRTHPVFEHVRQDPFTSRSLARPRGYAGDAVMLDYVYSGIPDAEQHQITEVGKRIFRYTAGASDVGRAVRERRDILTGTIDRIAGATAAPRMLSLACGHLREANATRFVREQQAGRLIGVDQDLESLAEVKRSLPSGNVVSMRASVKDLLSGRPVAEGLDLIYSAGLYDYLNDEVAARLTSILFRALRPGGVLLLANLAPNRNAAFMEAMMDWWLILRSAGELAQVTELIASSTIAEQRSFSGVDGTVVYLELRRS